MTAHKLFTTHKPFGFIPLAFLPPELKPPVTCPNPLHSVAEETDDLSFDASDAEVKAALEALRNVGTVDVTREDGGGGDLFAWLVTFTGPVLPAYSSTHLGDDEENEIAPSPATLSFPLLYAGGEEDEGGLGLGTLGAGGQLNVTRERPGTLGPLLGEVRKL